MVFKPLPLLRLPCLVHLEILGHWNLKEQYHLAKLSKRSAYVVKKITRRRQYSLTLSFEVPYIYLERIGVDEKTEKSEFLPIATEENAEQMKNTIILCAYAFNNPTLKLKRLKDGPTILTALEVAYALDLKFGHPLFALKDSNEEIYAWLIDLFQNVPKLTLDSVPQSGFPIKWYPSFECDFLDIQRIQCQTSWSNVERLMNRCMDCKKIRIACWSFTFKEVRPLLQKWIRGEIRMETVIIVSLHENIKYQGWQELDELLPGIPVRRVYGTRPKSPNKQFRDGCVITIHNGRKAFVGSHLDCFVMTTDFQELASITDTQTAIRKK